MDIASQSENLVKTVAGTPKELGAAACFGTPIERDGHTLVPVASLSFGYGLGFGGGSGPARTSSTNGNPSYEIGEGGGAGAGAMGSSSPVAVIDIGPDHVSVEPIVDTTRIVRTSMLLGGWVAFWLLFTIRTFVRERAKIRRDQIRQGSERHE